MPATSNGIIQNRQERLNASLQAAVEAIRLPLLEKGAVVAQELKALEEAMRETIQNGCERKALLNTLSTLRPQAERGVEFFRRALPLLDGDPAAKLAIESQLREAKDFLAWIVDLETRVGEPVLPFDESRLPETPHSANAPGYLSVKEARARVQAGK